MKTNRNLPLALALAAIFTLGPSMTHAQDFDGTSEGSSQLRSSVDSTYVLGQPMPFSVLATNDSTASESTPKASLVVEHPNTASFALTLERLDGHVDERPIYEATYDGNAAASVAEDGRIEFLEVPDQAATLAPGESVALDLDMKEIFGFELIDPGLYRLSIATAEGEAPYEETTFSIVFDPVTSRAYLEKLKEKGGYIESTWATRMLAEHP